MIQEHPPFLHFGILRLVLTQGSRAFIKTKKKENPPIVGDQAPGAVRY
jgi:hypothetical protein